MTDRSDAEAPESDVVEVLSADEAFELLSNETRLGVIRALFDADDHLPFSELRDAVGTPDSGQFNYHLEKLLGTFVRKTEDGYELTAAGTHVVGSILAGQYTKKIEGEPVAIDSTCPHCSEPLVGIFERTHVRVACEDCDRNVISLVVPPGAFEEHPREEWPFVAEYWTRRDFETAMEGFCPICRGPMGSQVERDPERVVDPFEVGVRYACERCGNDMFANAEAVVITHPAVVAFHYERGIDIADTPIWELDWAVQRGAEIVDEDPVRVEIPIDIEDDRLVLTLDEHADVIGKRFD